MADVSPHGLAIAFVQLVVVLVMWWAAARCDARRAAVGKRGLFVPVVTSLLFLVWYAILRVQPYRMSGTVFEYTLGIFDGVSLLGIVGLFWLHVVRQRGAQKPT